jgi:predicted phage terminase large subunit-like protein
MREFEDNTFLKSLFHEILYQNPKSEAPKWSLDGGIRVKRKTNPKKETVEAYGLVDGQPTSKHFSLLVYDDVVTLESVSTPEQIKKTTAALGMSSNLGAKGGAERFIGTRYHLFDTYAELMKNEVVKPRIYKATKSGVYPGEPVFLTEEELALKRKKQGPYIFNTQMLQDPVADKAMGFKQEWLRDYESIKPTGFNIYILADPANSKKKSSDYTVFNVIGLGPDGNYYLLDAVRDRLNLPERAKKLFELHRKWNPKAVGYEQYGMQADVEHIKHEMKTQNYRFEITELGGSMSKEDRIRQLVPVYDQKRFYLPKFLRFVNYEGKSIDYVKEFIEEEYTAFPVSAHDDMLDCQARIIDPALNAVFPKPLPTQDEEYQSSGSWLG